MNQKLILFSMNKGQRNIYITSKRSIHTTNTTYYITLLWFGGNIIS